MYTHALIRYGGAFARWGQPFRLRHVITGTLPSDLCVCRVVHSNHTPPLSLTPPPPSCCSGYFLCVHEDDPSHLTLRPSSKSEAAASLFCFRRCTNRGLPELHEGKMGGTMGEPCVKFGDSSVYLQHVDSKKWLGYQVSDDGCAMMIAVMIAVQ